MLKAGKSSAPFPVETTVAVLPSAKFGVLRARLEPPRATKVELVKPNPKDPRPTIVTPADRVEVNNPRLAVILSRTVPVEANAGFPNNPVTRAPLVVVR